MQTDLYNGCKTVVVVVPAETALLHRFGGGGEPCHAYSICRGQPISRFHGCYADREMRGFP